MQSVRLNIIIPNIQESEHKYDELPGIEEINVHCESEMDIDIIGTICADRSIRVSQERIDAKQSFKGGDKHCSVSVWPGDLPGKGEWCVLWPD